MPDRLFPPAGHPHPLIHRPCRTEVVFVDHRPVFGEQLSAERMRLPDGSALVAGQMIRCPVCGPVYTHTLTVEE